MTNNDVIRSVRYILNISDQKLAEIFKLADLEVPVVDIKDFLLDEEDSNYLRCDDETMAYFLDGLIYFKRGKDESRPKTPFELPMTNNNILKKLRVAFALKEDDMHAMFELAGFQIGRAELTAMLRKNDHPNYRIAGDQIVRYLLKGLTIKIRKP
ncbi:MAG: DUF1456 family protein [Bdellovibrionaceae bacterium]|nr:DUF1456 family protein [Bdellovibrio sp.]